MVLLEVTIINEFLLNLLVVGYFEMGCYFIVVGYFRRDYYCNYYCFDCCCCCSCCYCYFDCCYYYYDYCYCYCGCCYYYCGTGYYLVDCWLEFHLAFWYS